MSKSLAKAIDILRAFDEDHPEMGTADLSRRLDLAPSVVSRLLTTLRAAGLLEQIPESRKYRIGLGLFELGARYAHRRRWYDLATKAMREIVRRTGHTAYLGVLVGGDIVVLAREEGIHRVRLIVNPGERFPAYSTAIGKALLSRMNASDVRALYATRPLQPLTRQSITKMDALLADLEASQQRRYAAADQETFPGIRALGVALQGEAVGEIFGISLSYPTPSVSQEEVQRIIEQLLEVARRVGGLLGDPWWRVPSVVA